ncbi:MAG: sigma-70 family RNA polymerase sigma factor [Rhodothermales bacterium]
MQTAPLSIEECALAFVAEPVQAHRDRVVAAMEPVIRSIIAKLPLPSDVLAQASELVQVGVIATLQALDQFDPTTGTRFVTYAYARIRGEIVDHLRRLDPLPRRRRAKVAAARHAEDLLAQRLGDEPGMAPVAASMGISIDQLDGIRHDAWRRHGISLDAQDDEECRLLELVPDPSGQEGYAVYEWSDVRAHLEQAQARLSERERTILELYFNEGLTQTEIGALLGITEARVSQIRRRSLDVLEQALEPTLRYAA